MEVRKCEQVGKWVVAAVWYGRVEDEVGRVVDKETKEGHDILNQEMTRQVWSPKAILRRSRKISFFLFRKKK